MREKLIKWKQSDGYNQVVDSSMGLLIGVIFLQIAFLLITFMTKKAFVPAHLIGALTYMSVYVLVKDDMKDSMKRPTKTMFYLSVFFMLLGMTNGLMLAGITKVAASNPDLLKQMNILLILLDVGLIVAYLAIISSTAFKEYMEEAEEASLWDALIGELPEEVHPGDTVLGKKIAISYTDSGDKKYEQTDLPVVLPLKDRYLHMLILGATGSGKTSQVIIPMINNDMQNKELGVIAMEPKGDLAEKVFAMAKHYGREVQYFNPTSPNCPYFNPLYGEESDVVENMATTFKMLDNDSSQFFQNMNENLIRNSIKVLKRLYGNDANMLDLYTIVHNNMGKGKDIVQEFSTLQMGSKELLKENEDIAAWFLGDYFTGSTGDSRNATKTYEHCSGVRSQIAKLVSNKYLRKVLNPPRGHGSDVNFDQALADGSVIAITTSQDKLRDLGRFLGYFLILQLQASVFRRPPGPKGPEDRNGVMLYIDEFQVYSNPGFADMLTQGRSYRVASHLATQAREQIGMGGGSDGDAFIQLVSSNARNVIVFPGGNYNDAKYYSDQFGEVMKKTVQKGVSQQKLGWGNAAEFRAQNESVRVTEQLDSRFTPSDIIYRDFGEVTHLLIKNNTIQEPGIAKIEFIPRELDDRLDEIITEYKEEDEATLEGDDPLATTRQSISRAEQSSGFKPVIQEIEDNEKRKKMPRKPQEEVDFNSNDGLDEEYDAPVKSNVIMEDEDEDDEWL